MTRFLRKLLLCLCLFSCLVVALLFNHTPQEKKDANNKELTKRERSRGLVANKKLPPLVAFWDASDILVEYEWVFNVLLARVERPIIIVRSEAELEAVTQGVKTLNLLYITSEYSRHLRASSFYDDDGLLRLRLKWGQRLRLGFFQLSDEQGKSAKFYDVVNYVYRNYWSAQLEDSIRQVQQTINPGLKVEWMILGPANVQPFSPGLLLPASARPIPCNFYGSPNRGNRPQLAAALAKEPGIRQSPSGEQVHCDVGSGFHARDYRERLQRSVFTLCPSGSGDETFRLAETLASGGIPITVATYYSRRFLSKAPFFQLESWDKINEFITHQLALAHANGTYLDGLQADVATWWHNYMAQLQSRIAADVAAPLLPHQ